ncbi:ferredoxin [Pseudonocardia pini]|uniref:ferredoxin n=1 Tax=Pseudonocardia pini TaxID=2758030 RepID=UPI0015F0FA1B|nr:ferredoxin [Pseudonocardia pini]
MHIDIDRGRCEGYGVCVQSAPDLFDLDDEGDPVILRADVDGDLTDAAALAERSCPMQAVQTT